MNPMREGMFPGQVVDANVLNYLAQARDTREFSRGLLPHLVRRLVAATPGMVGLTMPAAEGVWRDGWDGLVQESAGGPYMPAGPSAWEMSNAKRVGEAAERNYRKRLQAPLGVDPAETTFVFVTMRHWPGKAKWVEAKRADAAWRDVKAIDSEDLWGWLETMPSEHNWVSEQIARHTPHTTESTRLPRSLPADAKGFAGRDNELACLRSIGEHGGGLVLISGQPGVGKTALAVHAGHLAEDMWPDGQIYVDLRGTHDDALHPRTVLERVLTALQVDLPETSTIDELAAHYRSKLAELRAVIILDDAGSEGQVRPLSPGTSASSVIVTSRSNLSGLDCNLRFRLEVLPAEHSVDLLRAHIGSVRVDEEFQAAAKIAQLCGHLPLALRVAAGLAARTPWSLAWLVRELTAEHSRLDVLNVGDIELRASFELSYRMLPEADKLTFRRLGLIPGSTFDASLAAAAIDQGESTATASLFELLERGLVDPSSLPNRFRLHDLLRLFAKDRAAADDVAGDVEDAEFRVAQYIYMTAHQIGQALDPHFRNELQQSSATAIEVADLLAWFDIHEEAVAATIRKATVDGATNEALQMTVDLVSYLEIRCSWEPMEEWCQSGLSLVEHIIQKGTADPEAAPVAEAMFLLASATACSGLRRFEQGFERCDRASSLIEPGSVLSAQIHNCRGNLLDAVGRREEALAEYRLAEEVWDGFSADLYSGVVRHNVGAVLMRLGRPAEALPHLYSDLANCRAVNDRIGEAKTLNTLGLVWLHLGEVGAAVTALQLSVQGHLGASDMVNAGNALNDLGLARYASGEHAAAYECHVADYEICERLSDTVGMAKARIRMADNLLAIDPDNASLAMEDIKHAKALLDVAEDRAALLSLAVVLGEIGFLVGDIKGASDSFARVALQCEELEDYGGAAQIIGRLCANLIKVGRAREALTHVRDLDIRSAKWPNALRQHVRAILVQVLAASGEHAEAKRTAAMSEETDAEAGPSPDEFMPLMSFAGEN
ncbi:NB-ARC domain-containing protein [Kribbella sp. NBC_01505]|uniref:ATP-binding protein n=1 Tax=Kribbella sp. NBC_01505 TaxID=2903580 RepID=UPI00386FDC73